MARKPQTPGRNSVSTHINAFRAVANDIQPPEPLKLRNAAERRVWDGIVRQRAQADWSEHELSKAFQLMQLEIEVRALSAKIARDGHISDNGKPNPAVAARSAVHRDALALTRTLRLMSQASPATMASRAKVEQTARSIIKRNDDDPDGILLARPN